MRAFNVDQETKSIQPLRASEKQTTWSENQLPQTNSKTTERNKTSHTKSYKTSPSFSIEIRICSYFEIPKKKKKEKRNVKLLVVYYPSVANFLAKTTRHSDFSPSGFISKWKRRKKCSLIAICDSCPPSVIPPRSHRPITTISIPQTHAHTRRHIVQWLSFNPWRHTRERARAPLSPSASRPLFLERLFASG